MKLILFTLVFLFFWALVHGGTRDNDNVFLPEGRIDMPTNGTPETVIYDDDHDLSGLIEVD